MLRAEATPGALDRLALALQGNIWDSSEGGGGGGGGRRRGGGAGEETARLHLSRISTEADRHAAGWRRRCRKCKERKKQRVASQRHLVELFIATRAKYC